MWPWPLHFSTQIWFPLPLRKEKSYDPQVSLLVVGLSDQPVLVRPDFKSKASISARTTADGGLKSNGPEGDEPHLRLEF
jgi:hypothetical protein